MLKKNQDRYADIRENRRRCDRPWKCFVLNCMVNFTLHLWRNVHVHSHKENLFIEQITYWAPAGNERNHRTQILAYRNNCSWHFFVYQCFFRYLLLLFLNLWLIKIELFCGNSFPPLNIIPNAAKPAFLAILKITHSLDHRHLAFYFLCQDNILK